MWETIKDRFSLLKTNAINSYHVQTAYFADNWASVGSTVFYTLTMFLFVKILYSNVQLFAGYTYDEMILLLLFGQLNFYSDWLWSTNNIGAMIDSVRTGELDLVLSKPIPSLFFITFRDISIVNRIKDGLPSLAILSSLLNWSNIHTDLLRVFLAFVVFTCGQICWHCFRFLFALPVFFVGQSNQIFQISGTLGENNDIPYEGWGDKLKFVFTAIIPSLMTAQMAVSVLLGKSNPLYMVILALVVTIVFLILKHIGWIIALRNYSSASS